MSTVDPSDELTSSDELIEAETRATLRRNLLVWRVIAAAALLVGAATVPVGRSIIGHATGYVFAAVVATTALSIATRLRTSLEGERLAHRTQTLRLVAFNLAACGLAALHAGYLARRFW